MHILPRHGCFILKSWNNSDVAFVEYGNTLLVFTLRYDDFSEADITEKKRKQREKLLKDLSKLKRKPTWKWLRRHFPSPWKPGEKGYPIFQVTFSSACLLQLQSYCYFFTFLSKRLVNYIDIFYDFSRAGIDCERLAGPDLHCHWSLEAIRNEFCHSYWGMFKITNVTISCV